ncbi:hypothetical protein AX17_001177 [Amanita inopinata Kibby_2008]|nr:hypothetical protein AX17_001177 [Amanita inopinata Kibby_2008]
MSTRTARKSQLPDTADGDLAVLSSVESLLLAQAVWELGGNAWPAVARLLSKHPLLSRPKSFFTPQSCHTMYITLMKEADLPCTDATNAVHSPENLRLAQMFYQRRLEELRSLIVVEETKFKRILTEIESIRGGNWDDDIRTNDSVICARDRKNKELKAASVESVGVEVFDGSDLSGVTDTSSPSQTRDGTAEAYSRRPGQGDGQSGQQCTTAQLTRQRCSETPPSNAVMPSKVELDVHIATEEYTQQAKRTTADIAGRNLEALHGAGSQETVMSGLSSEVLILVTGSQSPKEALRQARRQEEEEEEEETEAIRSEEEEAEQDVESEPLLPTQAQVKDEMGLNADESSTQVEQGDGAVITGNETHTFVRRSSRRHRLSVSSAPLVHNKPSKVRRPRRISETAEPSPASVSAENETVREADIIPEDLDQDQTFSPINVESGSQISETKRKASFLDGPESPRDKKRARDESEPIEDEEPEPSSTITRGRRRGDKTEEQVALKRFQNVIGMLHAQISQHRNGNIFHNPIKNSDAPDYHDIVKRPIDLKTIKAKVKDGLIANSLEYQRDIFLMFANAMMYNVPGSDVYAMAEDMMLESEAHITSFRQTEGLVRRL